MPVREWPSGRGEVSARVRRHDWASTPLGPTASWPATLRTVVDVVLASPTAMAVLWGDELVQIYNDAFAALIGARHPDALGAPVRAFWPEIEGCAGPVLDAVLAGRSRSFADERLTIARAGMPEVGWFDIGLGPLSDETGRVCGVLATVAETSARVRDRRRQGFRAKLESRLRALSDPVEVLAAASEEIGRHVGAGQVAYADIDEALERAVIARDWNDGSIPSNVGVHRLSAYGPAVARDLIAGQTLVVGDVTRDPRTASPEGVASFARTQVRALVDVPLVKGRLVALLAVHSATPRAWSPDEVSLVEEAAERTWAALERARAQAGLAASERRLRALVDGIPQLVWRAVAQGSWTWSSAQWSAVTALDAEQSLGLGWLSAVHPDDRAATRAAWRAADAQGGLDIEHRLFDVRHDRFRWYQTRAAPVHDESGRVVEWLGASTDIDDARRLQESQDVLVAELHHRTRNLLGTVRAVAGQTLRRARSMEEFGERFNARLAALSRVQSLLSRTEDEPLQLAELVALELDALGISPDDERVEIRGPSVRLDPSMIQTLALALHELATNTRKHGAFAGDEGRLAVGWRLRDSDEGRRIAFEWVETAPVDPSAQAHKGYGRELIERALPYTLGARTTYVLSADGLRCAIDLPLGRSGTDGEDAAALTPPASPRSRSPRP